MNTHRAAAIQLGVQLGKHAAEIGLTQQQVAERCKGRYQQGTVSRVFSGKYPAQSEVLCAIAAAVGCRITIEPLTGPEGGLKNEIMKSQDLSQDLALVQQENEHLKAIEMPLLPTLTEDQIRESAETIRRDNVEFLTVSINGNTRN